MGEKNDVGWAPGVWTERLRRWRLVNGASLSWWVIRIFWIYWFWYIYLAAKYIFSETHSGVSKYLNASLERLVIDFFANATYKTVPYSLFYSCSFFFVVVVKKRDTQMVMLLCMKNYSRSSAKWRWRSFMELLSLKITHGGSLPFTFFWRFWGGFAAGILNWITMQQTDDLESLKYRHLKLSLWFPHCLIINSAIL